jgi:hypothetical protein
MQPSATSPPRSAENAARIAGCIHVFEGAQGAIPFETMQRAARLARWYLREALRVLDMLDEPRAWGGCAVAGHVAGESG